MTEKSIRESFESNPANICEGGHGLYDKVDAEGRKTCPECRPPEEVAEVPKVQEIPVVEGAVVRLRRDYLEKKKK